MVVGDGGVHGDGWGGGDRLYGRVEGRGERHVRIAGAPSRTCLLDAFQNCRARSFRTPDFRDLEIGTSTERPAMTMTITDDVVRSVIGPIFGLPEINYFLPNIILSGKLHPELH